jgi:hypothetical protein
MIDVPEMIFISMQFPSKALGIKGLFLTFNGWTGIEHASNSSTKDIMSYNEHLT